ncbi:transposase [Nocardia nova]|uniref:transposase n=1 Tax=Nocardia nova TaxID=37330 RepID=UPI003F6A2E2B
MKQSRFALPVLGPGAGVTQGGGTAPTNERAVFTAVVFVPASGCAWRMLPPSFIDWSRAVIDAGPVVSQIFPKFSHAPELALNVDRAVRRETPGAAGTVAFACAGRFDLSGKL